MKILYTTDQIYLHGGIEKVLSQKANYLADVEKDDVIIVTYNQNGQKPCYHFSEKIKFYDLGVNYEIGKSYFHPNNLKKIPKHISALKKILKELKPDILVSCNYGVDFFFLPFIKIEIPKIKEFHASRYFSSRQNSLKRKWMYKISAFLENKYHQIVVLNPDEKKYYASRRISVIPNPSENSQYKMNVASKKILAAGRISPVKNFRDLIEIFAKLHPTFPDWELHFFGEDYLGTQEKLQQLINEFELQNHVRFLGVTKDMKQTMENYSIYAMTSETECFPMILLEALSVGIPIITYDAPTGPKYIVTNLEDAFLIPYKDKTTFAKKLSLLLQDENLRKSMGERAAENSRKFQIKQVMKEWKKLFIKLTIN